MGTTKFFVTGNKDLDEIFAQQDTTITAGDGLGGGGTLGGDVTLSVNTGGGITIISDRVTHADTSSQGDTSNTGTTYIQNLEFDSYGHVTGVTSTTIDTGGSGTMDSFNVIDGDSTNVSISNAKHWKFVEGGGIEINWSDTSSGTSGDPYELQFEVTDAPKWETPITLGVTLTGDVTGSGTVSVDGSTNRTISLTTAVANNSHSHSNYLLNTTDEFNGTLDVQGTITCSGDVKGFQSSDIRLKEVIEEVSNASAKLSKLDTIKFVYKADEEAIVHTGFIAQQVQEIMPEIVAEGEDGMLKIQSTGLELVSMLVSAHKEHSVEIQSLKDEIATIKKLLSK